MSSVLSWDGIYQGLLVVTLCVAAIWDIRTRRIPNQLTLGSLGIFIVLHIVRGDAQGLGTSLEGCLIGLAIGALAAFVNLAGGGDAKLLATAGACLGPHLFGGFCLYTSLATGLVALGFLIRDGAARAVTLRVSQVLLLKDASGYRRGGGIAPTTMPMALPMLIGGVALIWQRMVG